MAVTWPVIEAPFFGSGAGGGASPPPGTTFFATTRPSTVSYTSIGPTITTGATPHVLTAWQEVFSAAQVTADVHLVEIIIYATASTGVQTDCYVDIGIGGVGVETLLIGGLLSGYKDVLVAGSAVLSFELPIYIPSGIRISIRAQSLQASKVISFGMNLTGYASAPQLLFTGCDVYGLNTGTSDGASITPGASSVYGSWASIGSTTSRVYSALLPTFSMPTASALAVAYEVQMGVASAPIGRDYSLSINAAEAFIYRGELLPYIGSIGSGVQLQARSKCSGASPQTVTCAIMALY